MYKIALGLGHGDAPHNFEANTGVTVRGNGGAIARMAQDVVKFFVTNLCYEYNSYARGLEMAPVGVYPAHEQGQ